jgi:beta-aspartyl-peptidase (threonine type)
VGAVARDANGHVAAATSTGGMVDKAVGRVGDSPLVGAGTWADDERGAVSTTGHGESFIRTAFAARLHDDVRGPLDAHARARLEAMHARVGGTGGVILVDREGRAAYARITRTMSWALVDSEGHAEAGA